MMQEIKNPREIKGILYTDTEIRPCSKSGLYHETGGTATQVFKVKIVWEKALLQIVMVIGGMYNYFINLCCE